MSDLSIRARLILRRREAYRAVFLHPASAELNESAQVVLCDLRRVCFADRPTIARDREGKVDPVQMAMNEAARTIWLRISQALNIDDDKLHRMLDAADMREE